VPKVQRTQVNEVLLTALLDALGRWTGERCIRIDLEGHGREELFEDLDLTRTVGWFTSMFPLLLDLRGVTEWGECLQAIKEQLRAVPNRGVGFGVLRYLREHDTLRRSPHSQVCFNYLGQAQLAGEGELLRMSRRQIGTPRSVRQPRAYVLEVEAIVIEGCLQVHWTYSEQLHAEQTIRSLGEDFMESLRDVIGYSESSEGAYVPADFSLISIASEGI
jgi:non-ribosomal peptide synthase protein (TIGR01720 family)